MSYGRNSISVLERVVGNREAIGATLQDVNGAAVDLTGLTIKFRLVDMADGTVVVNNATATVVDASAGKVSYAPDAADVDTAGRYAMYFVDTTTSPNRLWPYDGARWQLHLKAETET